MVKWNEYTWYSKLAAAIFFLAVFPTWAFYVGMQYEKTREILYSQNNTGISSNTYINYSQKSPEVRDSELEVLKPTNKLAKDLVVGPNNIDGILFNVFNLNQIKPNFILSDDWGTLEKKSNFKNLSFHMKEGSVLVFKNNTFLSEIKPDSRWIWDIHQGTIYDPITFDSANLTYVVFGGSYCGNGGCGDSSVLYIFDSQGDIKKTTDLWQHGWNWGHGDQQKSGFQGDEKLDFVIAYKENLYLFPNSDAPIIALNLDGKIVRKIDSVGLSLMQILSQ